jgi:hypothetical protein
MPARIFINLHFSSEVNKSLGTGLEFLKFCPDWKEAPLFKEWQKYAKKCFRDGLACFHFKEMLVSFVISR